MDRDIEDTREPPEDDYEIPDEVNLQDIEVNEREILSFWNDDAEYDYEKENDDDRNGEPQQADHFSTSCKLVTIAGTPSAGVTITVGCSPLKFRHTLP